MEHINFSTILIYCKKHKYQKDENRENVLDISKEVGREINTNEI